MSDSAENSGALPRLNPFTRNPPRVVTREVGTVTRFDLDVAGVVTFPTSKDLNNSDHTTHQVIPLPGQTMQPGPSATEFAANEGPNYFLIKFVELWIGLPSYFVHAEWPTGTELFGPSVYLGFQKRMAANRPLIRNMHTIVEKHYPGAFDSTEFALRSNLEWRVPFWGTEAIDIEYNSAGQPDSFKTPGQTPMGAPWLVTDPLLSGSPSNAIRVTDEWHSKCNYILSPEDWLRYSRFTGLAYSKDGTERATPLNAFRQRIRLQGYFSPDFTNLIPFINA